MVTEERFLNEPRVEWVWTTDTRHARKTERLLLAAGRVNRQGPDAAVLEHLTTHGEQEAFVAFVGDEGRPFLASASRNALNEALLGIRMGWPTKTIRTGSVPHRALAEIFAESRD